MKYFIFDLDGTVVDTEKALIHTWQDAFKEYGQDYSWSEVQGVMGLTADKIIENLGAEVPEDFMDHWLEVYGKHAEEVTFFPGVEEVLKKLKEKGYTMGAVSSRSYAEYEGFFKDFKLDQYFASIVLDEDTENHKPDPDPICKFMEVTGATLEETIYIGDMPSDMEAAKNAGIYSGFVKWNGTGNTCEGADYSFDKPEEIYQLIEE